MSTASRFRWSRFLADNGRGLIVPMDHGLTCGPLDGIGRMGDVKPWIRHSAINGVILHKGFARRLLADGLLDRKALCIHLNGATTLSSEPLRKEQLTGVEAAIRMGADAVSIDLAFDGKTDAANLRLAGELSDQAQSYQLPLLSMLRSDHQVSSPRERITILRHLMRCMAELGVQAVKLPLPSSIDLVPEILDGVANDVDVFFAGGAQGREDSIIELATQAVRYGAKGLCVGRNVFQSAAPERLLRDLSEALRAQPPAAPAFTRYPERHGAGE